MEIVFVASGIFLIGALGALGIRQRRRVLAESERMPDWEEYQADRREYAEQMRVALIVSDARMVLYRQYAGRNASRREMLKHGISERRWRAAIILLRDLHIYGPQGYRPTVSEYHALRNLERHKRIHAARITRSPAAYVAP